MCPFAFDIEVVVVVSAFESHRNMTQSIQTVADCSARFGGKYVSDPNEARSDCQLP